MNQNQPDLHQPFGFTSSVGLLHLNPSRLVPQFKQKMAASYSVLQQSNVSTVTTKFPLYTVALFCTYCMSIVGRSNFFADGCFTVIAVHMTSEELKRHNGCFNYLQLVGMHVMQMEYDQWNFPNLFSVRITIFCLLLHVFSHFVDLAGYCHSTSLGNVGWWPWFSS